MLYLEEERMNIFWSQRKVVETFDELLFGGSCSRDQLLRRVDLCLKGLCSLLQIWTFLCLKTHPCSKTLKNHFHFQQTYFNFSNYCICMPWPPQGSVRGPGTLAGTRLHMVGTFTTPVCGCTRYAPPICHAGCIHTAELFGQRQAPLLFSPLYHCCISSHRSDDQVHEEIRSPCL